MVVLGAVDCVVLVVVLGAVDCVVLVVVLGAVDCLVLLLLGELDAIVVDIVVGGAVVESKREIRHILFMFYQQL